MAYDHQTIESRWQRYWGEHETFKAERHAGRAKLYLLDMFPYPSGAGLHVGHPEGYTATDIVSRYWRMRGVDVLHPMGWDAFGLPAEQYAIQTGTHPAKTTQTNIATFKRQLKMLGFGYDWNREIDTTDPSYVRWTQWIFLQLFKKGLAYQDDAVVNWCPALGTVLANEEVVDGRSERGNHPVERRPLRQWMLRITEYADRLESDLAGLDWPRGTLAMQREWIGRSEGAEIRFPIRGTDLSFTVFTTRPDTLFGATYCVLAPEHPVVGAIASEEAKAAVFQYCAEATHRAERDRAAAKTKTGVFTGAHAVNPANGEAIPIWVADYVMMGYGTGAIMAVPAHDDRDWEFARQFQLPLVEVVKGGNVEEAAFTAIEHGTLVNSPPIDGLRPSDAKRKMTDWLETRGLGRRKVQYKLRDWIFSRQRYWGEPIPIYFPVTCDSDPRSAPHVVHFDQPIAVDESELPIRLPELADFKPGDDPAGPLARAVDWRFFQRDGRWFARETNTMPQWAGSCWYYLRFLDPHNQHEAWSKQADADWMPVDLYVGGAEHAVLHLLYARFWHKVLFDLGYVKDSEPFQRLVHQGLILGEDGEKMSKSRGNVVNPDDIVRAHGADVMRMYEMFMGPIEAVKPWQSTQIQGMVRFRDRVYAVGTRATTTNVDSATLRLIHKSIKKVTEDIERLTFNTALSALMVLTNHLQSLDPVPVLGVETLALLISPFAPHLAEEIWSQLSREAPIAGQSWPTFDAALAMDEMVEIGVQINGKTRGTIRLPADGDDDGARRAAETDPAIARLLAGKQIKKVIYVRGRIVNFVVS